MVRFKFAALVLALTACSGTPVPIIIPGAPGTAATPTVGTIIVIIPNNARTLGSSAFGDPQTVEVGQTVNWVNQDTIAHTVTADDDSFDSGSISPGASFSRSFNLIGPIHYHCNIHPSMTGMLTVTGNVPTSFPTPLPSLGTPRP
ncbi:MAG: cupredoxin domain-containing protein [Bdellovibrionota bacterium]